MRGKLLFISGLAAGFVLGARAGREKYEELLTQGRKMLDHPTVQEAAGVAQAQASRLYSEGKDKLGQSKLGEKLSVNGHGAAEKAKTSSAEGSFGGTSASTGTTSGKTTPSTKPSTTTPGSGTSGSTSGGSSSTTASARGKTSGGGSSI